MKKFNFMLLAGCFSLNLMAQHNYDNQSVIYSDNDKVGVGTSTSLDNAKLTIKGDFANSWKMLAFDGNTDDWFLGSFGGGGFFIAKDNFSSNNSRFSIIDDKIGIGTITPTEHLTVVKTMNSGTTSNLLGVGSNYGNRRGVIAYYRTNTDNNSHMSFKGKANAPEHLVIKGDGRIGIGTISPTQKLDVAGNINMAGVAGRRIFMGGVGGSTFGIAYSATYPNYGIFYTEGSPDRVSISPNGNSTAGVMNILGDGNVGIGTTSPDAKLTVKGDIHTREVKVDLNGAVAPDFVFEPDYNLRTLAETEAYIKGNKHLPEIPSAAEMEQNGLELKEMNLKLLQKVEELTLYTIEQQKLIEKLTKRIEIIENN